MRPGFEDSRHDSQRLYGSTLRTLATSVLTGSLGWVSQALASPQGSPWALQTPVWYQGVIGTYAPYAMAVLIVGGVLTYNRLSENEGLMMKLLQYGIIASCIGGSLAYATFWGAAPSVGATLDAVQPLLPLVE
jgi:hypothetical protein